MNTVISFPVNALNANEHFLAQDIYTNFGVLIARKDSMITKKVLHKLNLYNIDSVLIKRFSAEDLPNIDMVSDDDFDVDISVKDGFENIKEFEDNYNFVVDKIQNTFKDVEEGKEIDTAEIKKVGEEVINILKDKTAIFSYLSLMKSKDTITFNHCLNVSIISQIFGKYLGMDDEEIEMIATCGLLHDIGKTKIDQSLLHKSSSITQDDIVQLQSHVLHSYQMIEKYDIPQSVKLGVLMHHERCDGSGYIMKYKSDQIHKFAKIIAIIDIFEAMTHDRPYRTKLLPLDALQYIKSISVSKLDYKYANSFISLISNSYKHSKVLLNTGDKGEIIFINDKNINRPLVKIENEIIDLQRETDVKIIDMI